MYVYSNRGKNEGMANVLKSANALSLSSSKQLQLFFIVAMLCLSFAVLADFTALGKNVAFAQGEQNQSDMVNCAALPGNISDNAVAIQNPNKDVCDVLIMREAPQITGHNGTILNKFLVANSLIEVTPAPTNMSGMGNATSPMVVVMGEFALLQPELKPMLLAISKSNWNVTAVHNHPILETPPMIFVHWDALGDLNTLIGQIEQVVAQNEMMQQQYQSQANNTEASSNPLSSIGEQLGSAIGIGQ
ncbi:MAG TPA: DUF1259 domain-containing protein [Phototrophicaceae bacterium]|nr:DUF1259 domain-containing protein [Phototrophicaceae bacterium]